MSEIIARRRYFSGSGDVTIATVEIEKPLLVAGETDEFACQFRIITQNSERVRSAHGIDELQSLLLALAYIKGEIGLLVKSSEGDIRWIGGDTGEIGIYILDVTK